ncbi:MAG: hypothetical protein N2255_05790, partial [Kiritimatiellae bacterium]|nr:hypothetical protein [Kiritimatiellia bacterium]
MKKRQVVVSLCLGVFAADFACVVRAQQLGESRTTGMRTIRTEVFEFTARPQVKKISKDRWAITFASRATCDATVAVVDRQGRIVRHLASGVLGKNAPLPFQKDSLSQTIAWDGTDDFGKPAPAGCKVKVGLGLKALFDKAFFNPYANINAAEFGGGNGVALKVDKDGVLHVVCNGRVRCFSRDGKYLRTLFPPPAPVYTPEKFAPIVHWSRPPLGFVDTIWGDKVAENPQTSKVGLNLESFKAMAYGADAPLGTPAFGPQGQIIVAYDDANFGGGGPSHYFHVIGRDGSIPPGSSMIVDGYEKKFLCPADHQLKALGTGAHNMATSPDGQWLYISLVGHSVVRIKWSDLKGPKMKPETFKGEADRAGSDNEHFNMPAGVACDQEGNVLVADSWNDRIQVFRPDGTFLVTVPVYHPQRLEVHPKTGAIYVMSWDAKKVHEPVMLRKLSGWKEGKELAKLEEKALRPYFGNYNTFALDAGVEPPILWVWGGDGLVKVTDKGTAFERGQRLDVPVNRNPEMLEGIYGGNMPRIVADPAREEVYLGSGSIMSAYPHFIRIDGRTGKVDPAFRKIGMDLAVGPDDLIYVRSRGNGDFILRYTRDGKPVPFKYGVKVDLDNEGGIVAGPGGKYKPGEYTAIYVGSTAVCKIWQPGLAVQANGDIWVWANDQKDAYRNALYDDHGKLRSPEEIMKTDWAAVINAPFNVPLKKGAEWTPRISVWDKDGLLKCADAFPQPVRGMVLRLDLGGNLYLLNDFNWAGQNVPTLEVLKNSKMSAGVLVKVEPKGSWPIARVIPDKDAKPSMPGLTNLMYHGLPVEGVTWAVPAVDDWVRGPGCACGMFFFDLDRFGRIFLPCNAVNSV